MAYANPQVRQPTQGRPDRLKTDTRIQMHQNLFTLTKNNSPFNIYKLGANIQNPNQQTFSGIANQKTETRFSP
jgi:hypothetical protein